MGSIFAHTFLVLGGEGPSLRIVAPEETMQRKKRPHRVSPRRFLYPPAPDSARLATPGWAGIRDKMGAREGARDSQG